MLTTEWMTKTELASYLNVSPRTVQRWVDKGILPPPEGVLMRVEASYQGINYRQCAIFEDGIWKNERNGKADEELYGEVKRFRPWED